MSDVEFRSLTMRKFGVLLRHHLRVTGDSMRRADYRAGLLASIAFNSNIDPAKTQPRDPADFFMSLRDVGKKERERRRQTPRQMDAVFERAERRRVLRQRAAKNAI